MTLFIKAFILKLVKQRSTSPHIGALINAYTSTAILYSPLTLLGVATTVYGLWGQELIRRWIPWFTFPVMVLCMVLFLLIMMAFFYKIVVPSTYAFQVQQQYKHKNPLVKDMKLVLEKLDGIEKRLEEIEKRLEELEGKK